MLRLGPKPVQAGIAKGAVKKAIDGIGGRVMMAKQMPGVFGAAFAPIGGGEKPMLAAAKTANAINRVVGIPDRADPADATGRESATAVERSIQAAGPDKFVDKMEDDPGFGFGGSSSSFGAGPEDEDRERDGGFGVGLLDA